MWGRRSRDRSVSRIGGALGSRGAARGFQRGASSIGRAVGTASYCAAKAALEAWTHAMRGEVAMHGVELSVFVAPHTQTEMGRATRFDGVTSLPVEHTARGLVRAIDLRPRRASSSPVYEVFLRLAAWFPSFMERQLAHSVRALLPH